MKTIRIENHFQGPAELAQGGLTARRLVDVAGQPATIRLRAPIPLETDLAVVEQADCWQLVDKTQDSPVVIMEARRWEPNFPQTTAVSLSDAIAARSRFPFPLDNHPIPNCFSCGVQPGSMRVHCGPLEDGRFAVDWEAPTWAIGPDGKVEESAIWAALDCAAGWYVVCSTNPHRLSFTVQFAAELLEPLHPHEQYVIVAWGGDWEGSWDGRKRGAASALFDGNGRLVAQSRSFWVSAT